MTTDRPLFISFLWHMHQPYYKDPSTGLYRLPWVRLHGTKDYLDMLEIPLEFPEIKQTFNFTPSLLEQLIDYTEHDAKDRHLELTVKPASELTTEEKTFILENFFLANWDTMIKPFPRYFQLLTKRGTHLLRSELPRSVRYFTDADFLDLQVLFNLAWIDPVFRERDPFLTMLARKGQNYTEQEKLQLVEAQFSILRKIVPQYKTALKNGQIELCVSPFYHPILPLLCDTNIARVAMPGVSLPQRRFAYPKDAREQIRMGLDYFQRLFGFRPVGMWPSEGSVSEDVIRLISQEGIEWIATDEDILSMSLGTGMRDSTRRLTAPDLLYRPHSFQNVSMIFRDHVISDLVGFVYSKWDPKSAAEDLIGRLINAWSSLRHGGPHLLPIILDGENAWEYYRNDGRDFLRYLYEGLSRESRLETVTVSEYLQRHGKGEPLPRVHAGSWIYANFGIWIGHEEDNRAWDYLSETRQDLELFQKLHPDKDLSAAWKAIYVAEGSDWNWWYGDEHTTETQKDFDELFRMNLMKVYEEMGVPVPHHLYIPVLREDRSVSPTVEIRGFIDPKIDGMVSSYYEWYQAAHLDIRKSGGSMHKSESVLSTIYYGFNKESLFIRLDPAVPFTELPETSRFCIDVLKPQRFQIIAKVRPFPEAELLRQEDGNWVKAKGMQDIAAADILEMGVTFSALGAREKDEIIFFVSLMKNGEETERYPWRGYISIQVPSPDFEAMMWR